MGNSSSNASLILILSIIFVLHVAAAYVKRTCDPGYFDNSHRCEACTHCPIYHEERRPSECFTVCSKYLTTRQPTSTPDVHTTTPILTTSTPTLPPILELSPTQPLAQDSHSVSVGTIIFGVVLSMIGIIIVILLLIYYKSSRHRHIDEKDKPEVQCCATFNVKTGTVQTSTVNVHNEDEVNAIPKDEVESDTVNRCPSTMPTYTSATTGADELSELAIGTTPYTARVHGKISEI